jgi:hypothetical protein
MEIARADNLTIAKVSYVLPIPIDMFVAITNRDREADDYRGILAGILERRTVAENVDYNGHFGSNIYFDILATDHTEGNEEAVVDMINAYAAGEEIDADGEN